jgi:hypothetical protein
VTQLLRIAIDGVTVFARYSDDMVARRRFDQRAGAQGTRNRGLGYLRQSCNVIHRYRALVCHIRPGVLFQIVFIVYFADSLFPGKWFL